MHAAISELLVRAARIGSSIKTGDKNNNRARNKADTEDKEKHLKQRVFDFPDCLHKQSDPRHEHGQRDEAVCVQHCQPDKPV